MNSPVTWLRNLFSWVLAVDTPPYPYDSWRELPREQWPEGYDPVTDIILQAKATGWATKEPLAVVVPAPVVKLKAGLASARAAVAS